MKSIYIPFYITAAFVMIYTLVTVFYQDDSWIMMGIVIFSSVLMIWMIARLMKDDKEMSESRHYPDYFDQDISH